MLKLKVQNFCLDSSINSGQFFRYNKIGDFYYIVLIDRVVKLKLEDGYLIIYSSNYNNLEDLIVEFFDLNTDYNKINKKLIEIDSNLKYIVDSCINFKILKMEPFETLVSYVISQNNSVNNIKNIVNKLSINYGEKILFENNEYYLFPTFDSIKDITLEELKNLKLGFRSNYVYELLNNIKTNKLDLDYIYSLNTIDAMNYLILNKGIGKKVASCVLLFAYKRYDVFPIDTWVKKIMGELFNISNEKKIEEFIKENYKEYSGIIIQYLFNYKRNN